MLGPLYALHLLGAVLWVGGMAFALVALRPTLHEVLAPPERAAVMEGVLRRFFRLVWHVMPVVIATGYALLAWGFGGFAGAGWHVHVMHLTGLLMAAIFLGIALLSFRRFRAARAAGNARAAAAALEQVRLLVTVNLALGLLTVIVAGWGRAG